VIYTFLLVCPRGTAYSPYLFGLPVSIACIEKRRFVAEFTEAVLEVIEQVRVRWTLQALP